MHFILLMPCKYSDKLSLMKLFLICVLVSIFAVFPNIISAQYSSGVDGGYEGSGDGGSDSTYGGQDNGGYTGCDPGPSTFQITGKVYQDSNQNGVFDGGDIGMPNQNIQMIQRPTNAVWDNKTTDSNGNYTMNPPTNTLIDVRHSTGLPAGAWRINPTSDTLTVQPNCPRTYNFGVYIPEDFAQNAPGSVCSGTTPTIPLSWSSQSGASFYKVLFLDSSVGVGVDNNLTTTGNSFNMTTVQGLVEGNQYGFIIAAYNSSSQLIAYSDGMWSHEKYGGFTSFPTCSPPGAFSFAAPPNAYCEGPSDSRFRITWTPASNAQYYTITAQSTNTSKGSNGWLPETNIGSPALDGSGYVNYDFIIPGPVAANERWEFGIKAYSSNGYVTPITSGSSYYVYGWSSALQCTGPGAFSWHSAPAPSCSGTTSQMTISWYPSAGATSYRVTPQTTNTSKGTNGWLPAINIGNPATQAGGYKQYVYTIPGNIAANEGWEFTLAALNGTGETNTTGGSSYYHYGWINALNCQPVPGVNFSITTESGTTPANSVPARANQNSPVTLNWSTTNSPTSCTASSSPSQGYWNGTVAVSGSQAVTTTFAGGPLIFNLICSNASGSSSNQSIQLTIDQYPKPYIQTTGGDVHTNESIYTSP